MSNLFAQQPESLLLKPLKIGDVVPEIKFDSVFNNGGRSIALSDLKGKAVILDFWATWCGACLAGLPKMVEIQKRYQNDLVVLPVSMDRTVSLKTFYQNNNFQLPTAWVKKDHVVNVFFPHQEIPHYIWINKDNKVAAITSSGEITDKNIQDFLNGTVELNIGGAEHPNLMDASRSLVIDSIEINRSSRSRSLDSNILSQSVISKYDHRITQSGSFTRKGYKDRFLNFNNYSISHLYLVAHFGFVPGGSWDKLYIDIDDSTLVYPIYQDKKVLDDWQENHSYSYRLVLPEKRANKSLLYKRMQDDLKDFFAIDAKLEMREVDCMVLKALDTKMNNLSSTSDSTSIYHSIFRVSMKNQPVKAFLNALKQYGVNNNKSKNYKRPQMEILDETGIANNIDIDIRLKNLRDLNELNGKLKEIGLSLTIERRTRELLVLSHID